MVVKSRKLAILTVATAVLLGAAALASPEDASQEAQRIRLTSQKVSQLAATELSKAGFSPSKFKAGIPEYLPEGHQWRVFFMQVGPILAVDGEMLVVIDDHTGKGCVQQAEAIGPCT